MTDGLLMGTAKLREHSGRTVKMTELPHTRCNGRWHKSNTNALHPEVPNSPQRDGDEAPSSGGVQGCSSALCLPNCAVEEYRRNAR